MNTDRAKNVAAFVRAFAAHEGRGPTADEVCTACRIQRTQLPAVVKRLERQGVIRHTMIFEPRVV